MKQKVYHHRCMSCNEQNEVTTWYANNDPEIQSILASHGLYPIVVNTPEGQVADLKAKIIVCPTCNATVILSATLGTEYGTSYRVCEPIKAVEPPEQENVP